MQKKIPEKKEEFVKLLMNKVIHERTDDKKRRYVRKLNSDLIRFYWIGKHLENILFWIPN